ncbi:MAG: peptidylprolyl isomerase [Acidobacteriia bacterium]|nr:peptidylprolyl isomerase [Terriglobia bacterium]MBV9742211.1 peptidylprolyl isomerase [Terriglobia bacterium]
MRQFVYSSAAALLCLSAAACRRSAPANVAAEVNNHAITYAELEKTYQSQPQTTEGSSEDQVLSDKLNVLGNLITSEILLQRAEKLGLMAVDADVETEFNKMKAPYTKEEFDRQLGARKMTVADLKSQLRRDLTIQKLINKEITSHITITDMEVANFYYNNKASFNLPQPAIHLAQILVTKSPDSNVRNLKNSKARNDAEARTKIEDIAARLKNGEDFVMLAQNYSEDPETAANGGDRGLVPESAFANASPELQKLLASLPPGGISPIIPTQEGYVILKIISKEPAGQRELNDPRVQHSIRDTLLNRKDTLLKTAYYEVARNTAKVVNYFAQSIMQNAEKAK